MSECVTSNAHAVNNSTHETPKICIPEWTKAFKAVRFGAANRRDTARALTLSDFIRSTLTDTAEKRNARLTGNKDQVPAWALTNDTGTSEGRNSGLVQLDFDKAEDPNALKSALATVTGVIVAAFSASGHGVFALLHAPDFEGGVYVGRQIAQEMRRRGLIFEKLDPRCEKPCQLRYETFDPSPYIAPTCDPIAPIYDETMLNGIADAAKMWRADALDFESAAKAIAAAAVAAQARIQYGRKGRERIFNGGCDVQVIATTGACKTQGGVMPLRRIAETVHARQAGGLRTTDAAFYEAFIDAAYDKELDDKGKLTALHAKPNPDTLVSILDESGDTETSRAGNAAKAQQNLIRRIACYDQNINIGATLELQKRYGQVQVPETVPCRLVQYRATTPNQLDTADIQSQMEGGNGRRTLYAEARPVEAFFDCADALDDKLSRIPSQAAQDRMCRLASTLASLFPANAEADGKAAIFTANFDELHTARQAAFIAFKRAGAPEEYADTLIYNTALWLAVIRHGLAKIDDDEFGMYEPMPTPSRSITAQDIYAATAIALNSWQVAKRLTARGAAAKLAAARTDSEKTQLLLAYIAGRQNQRIPRDNLVRKFGKDVLSIIDAMCLEGVLRVSILVNADGKNPHTYYEVTPEGEEQSAAEAYAQRTAARVPKARPRSQGTSKEYAECDELEKAKRVKAYIDRFTDDNEIVQGNRNNALNKLIFELQKAGMWDAISQAQVEALAASAGLDAKETKKLMRERQTLRFVQ